MYASAPALAVMALYSGWRNVALYGDCALASLGLLGQGLIPLYNPARVTGIYMLQALPYNLVRLGMTDSAAIVHWFGAWPGLISALSLAVYLYLARRDFRLQCLGTVLQLTLTLMTSLVPTESQMATAIWLVLVSVIFARDTLFSFPRAAILLLGSIAFINVYETAAALAPLLAVGIVLRLGREPDWCRYRFAPLAALIPLTFAAVTAARAIHHPESPANLLQFQESMFLVLLQPALWISLALSAAVLFGGKLQAKWQPDLPISTCLFLAWAVFWLLSSSLGVEIIPPRGQYSARVLQLILPAAVTSALILSGSRRLAPFARRLSATPSRASVLALLMLLSLNIEWRVDALRMWTRYLELMAGFIGSGRGIVAAEDTPFPDDKMAWGWSLPTEMVVLATIKRIPLTSIAHFSHNGDYEPICALRPESLPRFENGPEYRLMPIKERPIRKRTPPPSRPST